MVYTEIDFTPFIDFIVPFALGVPVGFLIGYKFYKWLNKKIKTKTKWDFPQSYRIYKKLNKVNRMRLKNASRIKGVKNEKKLQHDLRRRRNAR